MSDFGEVIIERLNNQDLQDNSNPMHQIIDKGIGEWLQVFSDADFFEQFFFQEATGKYLDLHGKDFGVLRRIDESDDVYRARIIYETLSHVTVGFLRDVYNVELYSSVDGFNVADNDLASDNPYLATDGFMGIASNDVKSILAKKFVIGGGVTWL